MAVMARAMGLPSASTQAARRTTPIDERAASDLGARLLELRLRRRFSRAQLADLAGISEIYLKQIEKGYNAQRQKPVEPTARVLRRIADALAEFDEEAAVDIYLSLCEAAGMLPPRARLAGWVTTLPIDASDAGIYQQELVLRLLKALRRLPPEAQEQALRFLESVAPPPDPASPS